MNSSTNSAAPTMKRDARSTAADAELVELVRAGATEHFEVLLRRYNQRLFRVARAILRDDIEAEDAVQQAYLTAFTQLSQLSEPARFAGWVTRITAREAVRRRERSLKLTLVDEGAAPLTESPADGPEERAAFRQLRDTLEDAIDLLPDAYRVVLVLRDVQDLSTRETAEALEVSEESVRVRLHRARRALKQALNERDDLRPEDVFSFEGQRCDRMTSRVMRSLPDGDGQPTRREMPSS